MLAIGVAVCLVVAVSDGDTFTARCGEPGQYEQVKVRMAAIDAPERRQAFGERAKEALSEVIYKQTVEMQCPKTDHYKRSVCTVRVAPRSAPDGPRTLDVGLAMVSIGLAWWYRDYAKEQTPQERGQYEFAEGEAKAKRAGLWVDLGTAADPLPPWEWRRQVKKAARQKVG